MRILEVNGLEKTFGRRQVVKGVSFHVDEGEIVGLLGPNGAGKTTCFRMTCGLITPDRGTVLLNEIDVTRWPMHRRAKEGGMGYLAQESSVFRKLSVEQNLLGVMELLGMPGPQRRARCDELLEQFRVTHIRHSQAARLSGGERRRLEIARCLVSDPEIIMLDEPFAGIDPVTVQSIQAIIRELSGHGIAILITDHAAREILQITDRTYVISGGEVLCDGSPEEVIENEAVRKQYLGEIDSIGPRPAAARRQEPAAAPARHETTAAPRHEDAADDDFEF